MVANGTPGEETSRVHSTRFKDVILELILGLCESRKWVNILLTLDGEMGQPFFEACQNSNKDDGPVLAKASQIVRRVMFSDEEVFDGDISRVVPSVFIFRNSS